MQIAYSDKHMIMDVDYEAISRGSLFPWFMEEVHKLDAGGFDYPHQTHGSSAMLAQIHDQHPEIAFTCALLPPIASSRGFIQWLHPVFDCCTSH